MGTEKKIIGFTIGFILIGLCALFLLPKEEKKNTEALIRIGAGDDMSGMLMEEIVEDLSKKYDLSTALESSAFQDC